MIIYWLPFSLLVKLSTHKLGYNEHHCKVLGITVNIKDCRISSYCCPQLCHFQIILCIAIVLSINSLPFTISTYFFKTLFISLYKFTNVFRCIANKMSFCSNTLLFTRRGERNI